MTEENIKTYSIFKRKTIIVKDYVENGGKLEEVARKEWIHLFGIPIKYTFKQTRWRV